MQYKLFYSITAIFTIGLMGGCRKFVQVDPPTSRLVTQSVFSTSGAATAAVTSIYTQMQADSYTMSQIGGLLSDELSVDIGNNSTLTQYYLNAMNLNSNAYPWSNAYNYIYQANACIEQLQQSGLSSAIKDQLTGEVRFIRAFWLFYLVNCYGDIPLTVTTDYKVNTALYRTGADKVYEQIISDLSDAEGLLNSNYVDATDTTSTIDRVRPTKWSAYALVARAYLHKRDYANAEKSATVVINNTSLYNLNDSLNDVFLANSQEAIWQLAVPLPTNINTMDGNSFILIAAPSTYGSVGNVCTLSRHLLDSFETGDRRKDEWVGVFTTADSPAVSYYFPYKYKVFESTTVTEYTMVLRLAEQYLIRAEARAQQGIDLQGAVDDLNKIRHRAGLPEYGGPMDKFSILAAVLHERKVELFCEWGHRWFDLIRMGKANEVMSVVTPQKGGVWNANWELFPIPQSERDLDINLTQNSGY